MVKLNERQKAAASFTNGVASVIAIPGAGKTLTMVHRIGHLIKSGVAPESILGLTFTRNAAQAMRQKLKPVVDELANRVTLSTIHSFCLHLLKSEGKVFEILTGTEQIQFIRIVIRNMKLKNVLTGMIIREISLAKNNLISVEEFKDLYSGDETMQRIADIYLAYEQEKNRKMLMDFNDLLIETHNLLNENDEVRDKYQQTYRHILLDESQDVNPAQMAILGLLVGNLKGNRSFWVCGDDWQSIFAFMGASVGHILNFKKSYLNCKQFILDTNYRSTPQILKACQNLIKNNIKKIDKTLNTKNPDGDEVIIIDTVNEEDEAVKVMNEVKDLNERKGYSLKDIAVLYRANSQSRPIEEVLTENGIPYHIENGTSFYQRYEVKILLDYLRFIHDPDGDEALRNIINIPNRYIGRKFINELEEYASTRNTHLYKGLRSMPVDVPYLRKFIKEFIRLIDPLIVDSSKISPAEMIQILRQGLDYDRYITDDDIPSPDDSKIENINQLQLVANRYKDIKSLLNYTDTFKEEISNDQEGVALMTIHKSKGLEFPAVFVIGLVEGILPNKNGDIEEERRIAFVGMSRAMKLLYLTYPLNYMGKQVKKSSFLDEIEGKI